MSTRTILGAVGAVIGAYFGNPQLGWAIGSAIGGAIDPEIIKGPSIGDIASQTSQEGTPRPIVFALSQPLAGNIIASGEPRIVRRRESQGKGGPKVETESVYRTYAIGICEGPVTRVVRVWRNGEKVYDRLIFDPEFVLDQVLDGMRQRMSGNNQNFAQRARFFLGGWDQLPSPDLEQEFGIGTTPAHRGTCYMVMANEDLTDFRGAIPQFVFQVERCEGEFYTSRPYPINDQDSIGMAATMSEKLQPFLVEGIQNGGDVVSGTLDVVLTHYDHDEPEELDTAGDLIYGELGVVTYSEYEDGEPDEIDTEGDLLSGVLEVTLIPYDEGEPDELEMAGTLISGSLT